MITQYFTNGMVMLLCGVVQIKPNIRRIKPYKSDAKLEDFNSINIDEAVCI